MPTAGGLGRGHVMPGGGTLLRVPALATRSRMPAASSEPMSRAREVHSHMTRVRRRSQLRVAKGTRASTAHVRVAAACTRVLFGLHSARLDELPEPVDFALDESVEILGRPARHLQAQIIETL